mmetsp:Transcript_135671/g.433999  ORF Transcript_135671/g.433999 Transcript_135671/m.433999 type:complete len:542 (-) Transcript_135671:361-1986(-)
MEVDFGRWFLSNYHCAPLDQKLLAKVAVFQQAAPQQQRAAATASAGALPQEASGRDAISVASPAASAPAASAASADPSPDEARRPSARGRSPAGRARPVATDEDGEPLPPGVASRGNLLTLRSKRLSGNSGSQAEPPQESPPRLPLESNESSPEEKSAVAEPAGLSPQRSSPCSVPPPPSSPSEAAAYAAAVAAHAAAAQPQGGTEGGDVCDNSQPKAAPPALPGASAPRENGQLVTGSAEAAAAAAAAKAKEAAALARATSKERAAPADVFGDDRQLAEFADSVAQREIGRPFAELSKDDQAMILNLATAQRAAAKQESEARSPSAASGSTPAKVVGTPSADGGSSAQATPHTSPGPGSVDGPGAVVQVSARGRSSLVEADARITSSLDRFFHDESMWRRVQVEIDHGAKVRSDRIKGLGSGAVNFRVVVPKPYPGVQYRRTKNLEDRHAKYAENGMMVAGHVEDDGDWLRISASVFLPMRLGAIQILEPLPKDGHVGADGDSAKSSWLTCCSNTLESKLGDLDSATSHQAEAAMAVVQP